MTERKKVTIDTLRRNKAEGKKTVLITAYDAPTTFLAEAGGVDGVLVGDSLGQTILGYDNTVPVTMNDMLIHAKAVKRTSKYSLLIGDLPLGSYLSIGQAIKNACKFIKIGMDLVKLEGCLISQIKAISQNNIGVMAHLGVLPQSVAYSGGYKIAGRTKSQIEILIEQAKAVEEAGAIALLLEGTPSEAAGQVAESISIPTFGIGAGNHKSLAGQLIIWQDIVGMFFGNIKPKFIKKYCDAGELITKGISEYCQDVRNGKFPFPENCYTMKIEDCPKVDWQSPGC